MRRASGLPDDRDLAEESAGSGSASDGDPEPATPGEPATPAAEDADPFLMCDNFAFAPEKAKFGEDDFPIGWHPHRGMDILSYQKTGLGRHGDSLGHRETYETPGIQWMSCGSGVEHASRLLETLPDADLQLGLWLVGGLDRINNGVWDGAIAELVNFVR